MSDINMEKFAKSDFGPDRYVKELARSCVGGEELQQQKEKIQVLAEDTASALKKNVYENYMQFIETATEISHLEAEMYKLSRLLSEQRSVLTTLSHASVLGHDNTMSRESLDTQAQDLEAERAEEQRKNKLNTIIDKVEGCMNLLDIPERTLLHEGDLLEIDAEENTALQRMHVYLFTDCVMLTSWISNRRGPMRYKFQASYPISTLAVVNVRDLGNVKQAFKVLAFPDTRVFQCNSFAIKKDWLDKFDVAKKMHIEKENSKLKKKEEKPKPELVESPSLSVEELPSPQIPALPEWLVDVTEELDVLIVERHFEKTYKLMVTAQQSLNSDEFKTHPERNDILKKIEQKQKILIDILLKELDVTHNWSPRGGLQSSRCPVLILNKFNMTSQACELFLAICSHTVKVHIKGVQLESTINTYVKQVGEVFFCSLSDALTEFTALFPKNKISAFVVWASMQLRMLLSQIIKQVFTPQCALDLVLECVQSLRDQCMLFCEFGLDLRFQLNSSLRTPTSRALKEYKDKIVDSMKSKITEDKWTPVNMHTKAGVHKFLAQMENLGLILAKYVINETWVDLSSSTIWFAQSVITIQKVGLTLVTKDLMETLDDCIYAIFNARLILSVGNDSIYAQKNFRFILDTVMPLMLRCYREEVGYENEKLVALAKKHGLSVALPKKSNITKYTSNEYL